MGDQPEPDYDEYLHDVELWETRQLGADPKYARRISPEQEKELDDALGLELISVRLNKELVAQIKALAKKSGIGHQPYIRQLLTRHVSDSLADGEVETNLE
jgi:hypothetical protein